MSDEQAIDEQYFRQLEQDEDEEENDESDEEWNQYKEPQSVDMPFQYNGPDLTLLKQTLADIEEVNTESEYSQQAPDVRRRSRGFTDDVNNLQAAIKRMEVEDKQMTPRNIVGKKL